MKSTCWPVEFCVRSIVGWNSPLNNAVYGMHDFGYDNLPSIAQSLLIFGGILAIGIIISRRAVKKYNFTFLVRESGKCIFIVGIM